jgi:DNA (cytosine-5)-methyltransferase 1
MTSTPRLLDLFCGAGGAGMGYHRAGFEVVGVDLHPQPHYPFEFHQADAMTFPLDGFDAIHASPPCQLYSLGTRSGKVGAPDLIGPVRDRLMATSVPWVIENVRGAASTLNAGLLLCGSMFGLAVQRHRLFESPMYLWSPQHDCYLAREARDRFPVPDVWLTKPCWNESQRSRAYGVTGEMRLTGTFDFWKGLMDMPWAGRSKELTEAIPPAYTEWIGTQLLRSLEAVA